MLIELTKREARAVKEAIDNTFTDYDHVDNRDRVSLKVAKSKISRAQAHTFKMEREA
jgi:hypothetical protein